MLLKHDEGDKSTSKLFKSFFFYIYHFLPVVFFSAFLVPSFHQLYTYHKTSFPCVPLFIIFSIPHHKILKRVIQMEVLRRG